MHALHTVTKAIHHAERLADEAEDLGMLELTRRLRHRADALTLELDITVGLHGEIAVTRADRALAHEALAGAYGAGTLRLEELLHREEASRLSPGSHLDVAERARFRLRRLAARDPRSDTAVDENLELVQTDLERALFAYETAVDAYLLTAADAASRKERTLAASQALRVELERAKLELLARARPGSSAYARIKRQPVRTRRARWIDEARARDLLQAEARSEAAPNARAPELSSSCTWAAPGGQPLKRFAAQL